MINKLVMLLVSVACLWFTWTGFSQGYFGLPNNDKFRFEVPAYAIVKSNKEALESSLKKLENLNTEGINSATENVENKIGLYEDKKLEYDILALTASKEEIAEANKVEKYLLDYLWIRIGNYASDNAVKFKISTTLTDANVPQGDIKFDITGSYISIINFIYDLENDEELDFEINGIEIAGSSAGADVKAQFYVHGINVVTSPDEGV